jgi:hypothetical protein
MNGQADAPRDTTEQKAHSISGRQSDCPSGPLRRAFRRNLSSEQTREIRHSRNGHKSLSFRFAGPIFTGRPRNIPISTFVYWGAAASSAVRGKMQKTPRWQPRGRDTQFFRPLLQEEEVSSPATLLDLRLRVNFFLGLRPSAADSIPLKGI